jgi:NAD-dependent histone deacetylase SIR2
MKQVVEKGEVPHCQTPQCNGLVKPDIVFFGEALPEAFFLNRTLPGAADLCIIMGTSLTVQPFASLPSFCRDETPRLLINMERVGGLGSRADDVLLLGDCDDGVRKLAKALGWLEELETLWEETNPDKDAREKGAASLKTRDERLHDEVERLTADVDRTLHISNTYHDRVREHLSKQHEKSDAVQGADAGEASRGACGVVSAQEESAETPARNNEDKRGELSVGGEDLTHVFPHLDKISIIECR